MKPDDHREQQVAVPPRPARKSVLPPKHAALVGMMQAVNFGRITFHVQGGAPDPAKPCRTRQTVKLGGGENGPRPEAASADCTLCKEQTALLTTLAHVHDGACVTVEVRHGLPFLVEIEQDHQAA